MATLSTSNLTLADWAKRSDPDGRVPIVAELLSQSNEILEDCVFKEGNLPTGERVVIRTGLPSVYWRALNQGIPNSKSTTAQVLAPFVPRQQKSIVMKNCVFSCVVMRVHECVNACSFVFICFYVSICMFLCF